MNYRENRTVLFTRVAPRVLLAALRSLQVAVLLDQLAPVRCADRRCIVAPTGAQEGRRAHEERHTDDESFVHVFTVSCCGYQHGVASLLFR